MAANYRLERSQKQEIRQQYTGLWAVEMMKAPCADPCCCLASILCPPCASYYNRQRALGGDLSRYTCCQGYSFLRPNCLYETSCPELCLCAETLLCFPTSVVGTRFYLQDQLQVQNTQCDNNLIAITICLEQLACLCQCAACITGSQEIGQCADTISCVADQVYCSVCACMQTQHKVQLDARDRGDYQGPGQQAMMPPGVQMMSAPPPPPPDKLGGGGPGYFPGQQAYPHPGMVHQQGAGYGGNGGAIGYQPGPPPPPGPNYPRY